MRRAAVILLAAAITTDRDRLDHRGPDRRSKRPDAGSLRSLGFRVTWPATSVAAGDRVVVRVTAAAPGPCRAGVRLALVPR